MATFTVCIVFNLIKLCNPWDEITLNITRFNTDGEGHEVLTPCTFSHLPYSSTASLTGVQKHYCFIHLNEIPWLLLLQMNYVCVGVLICDRHCLPGNVGHILMHNNSLQLYSHRQIGRLSVMFFHKRNSIWFIYCLFYATAVEESSPYPTLPNGSYCCPNTFTNSLFLKSNACQWHCTADNNIAYLKSPW